ncbi:MAG: hypothetical protein NWE77_07470 [Candidatus Bathyarchaeota archaeon]|nr:hypothetical protein [Candidatus Bathyarchaeota archaeon]
MDVPKRRNSGQVLLIAAFIMAFLLLSAELYIFEVGKIIYRIESNSLGDSIFAIERGSRRVVIGSLANISQGGSNLTLATNLARWGSFVWNQHLNVKSLLNFTGRDTPPYTSGLWIDWSRTDGIGVSGAFVNFSLNLSGMQATAQTEYYENVTTSVNVVDGMYRKLEGEGMELKKQVNVTCRILNEGEPALAKNVTLFFEDDGDLSTQNWIGADSPSIADYGNGTYFLSFIAETQTRNDPMLISAQVRDLRDIFVLANATCIEI